MITGYGPGGISTLEEKDAIQHYIASLGLINPSGRIENAPDLAAVSAETIRLALWALSIGSGDGVEPIPVYITRLLNTARDMIPSVLQADIISALDIDAKIDQVLRNVLIDLESLGDIATASHGHRLPGPLRCVPLLDSNRWLLIGCVPARFLPLQVRHSLECVGATRLLKRAPADLIFHVRSQTLEDWDRRQSDDLDLWTSQILTNYQLSSLSSEKNSYEYYAPGAKSLSPATSDLQFYRWTFNVKKLNNGRYLMRERMSYGAMNYFIGEHRSGKTVASAGVDTDRLDIRRLMYGLDSLNGCPVKINAERLKNGNLLFRLSNELPAAENRLFLALGRLHPNRDCKYYPRVWEIKATYVGEMISALRRLKVNLAF